MKKLLLIVMVIIGLGLLATTGSSARVGDLGFTDTDTMIVTGTTGSAELRVQRIRLHFDHIQPGEQLAVTWWVENVGHCPLQVDIALSGVPGYINAKFFPGNTFQMRRGWRKNVALVVRMPLTKNLPGHQNRSFTITVTFTSRSIAHRWQAPVYDP